MSVRFGISVSLDGYLAGPDPSEEDPLGRGGMQLHEWVFGLAAWREPHGLEGGEVNASTPVVDRQQANAGAYLMGRKMFGGGEGEWGDPPWNGWGGGGGGGGRVPGRGGGGPPPPPSGARVGVAPHPAREPVSFENGTTFEF